MMQFLILSYFIYKAYPFWISACYAIEELIRITIWKRIRF